MRKLSLLTLLLITKIAVAQTTNEEFNYITKGYKIALDSGLDIKAGYTVEKLTVYNTPSYSFEYKLLIRQKDKSLAGVILVATSKVWSNVYYQAIPINNNDLLVAFNNQLKDWDKPMLEAYSESATFINSELIKYYQSTK